MRNLSIQGEPDLSMLEATCWHGVSTSPLSLRCDDQCSAPTNIKEALERERGLRPLYKVIRVKFLSSDNLIMTCCDLLRLISINNTELICCETENILI